MGEPVHTNLPWIVVSGDENVCINGRDGFVCMMDSVPPMREANAALIVDRVNGWDALAAERDALQARVRESKSVIDELIRCANATVGASTDDPDALEAFDMFVDAKQKARAFLSSSTGADHD